MRHDLGTVPEVFWVGLPRGPGAGYPNVSMGGINPNWLSTLLNVRESEKTSMLSSMYVHSMVRDVVASERRMVREGTAGVPIWGR